MRTGYRWSLSGLCAVLMVTQGYASVDSNQNIAEELSDSETVYKYDNRCSGTTTVTYRKVYHSYLVRQTGTRRSRTTLVGHYGSQCAKCIQPS